MIPKIYQRFVKAVKVLRYGIIPNVERLDIPPLTNEEIEEIKKFFPMKKFFIFGHARSGTTLLARLIRLHPEVHCNWQAHFFTRKPLLQALVSDPQVANWLSRRSNRWNRGNDLSPVILRAVSDFILERDALKEGKSIVGDKSPNNLLNGEAVQLLHKIYPDARLIFMVRDGRDTILSHRLQSFIDSPQHLSKNDLRIRKSIIESPDVFIKNKQSVFTPNGLRNAAAGWVQNINETNLCGQELYGYGFLRLRYEDLLAEPVEVVQQVWDHIGTKKTMQDNVRIIQTELENNPDAEWQRRKENTIAAKLPKGQVGSWLEVFTDRDKHIFNQVAGETLKIWGYKNDIVQR